MVIALRHAPAGSVQSQSLKAQLRPITVSDCFGALVTKSANGCAVRLSLSASPHRNRFAQLIWTIKARSLGPENTRFVPLRPACPTSVSVSNRRDLAILRRRRCSDNHGESYHYFPRGAPLSALQLGWQDLQEHNELLETSRRRRWHSEPA